MLDSWTEKILIYWSGLKFMSQVSSLLNHWQFDEITYCSPLFVKHLLKEEGHILIINY